MKEYTDLFFDLDGTLTNSFEGIKNGLELTFSKYGKKVPAELYRRFVGPPLATSFSTVFEKELLDEAIAVFREYYSRKGLLENEVYEGMTETLSALKSAGRRLYVATSKRLDMARRVLDGFGLSVWFDDVFGADLTLVEKEDVLAAGLKKTAADKSRALMIGDTDYDLRGARVCGVDCMLVRYGFGDFETACRPELWADSPRQIAEILLG